MADSRSAVGARSLPSIRRRVHELLELARPGDHVSRAVDVFIIALIGLNVVAMVISTVHPVRERFSGLFTGFEAFSLAAFSVEYVLRVWSITAHPRYTAPVRGRLRYVLTPLALIDLVAILPAILPFLRIDLRVVRAARLFRLVRIGKLVRYSRALQLFGRVIAAKKDELLTTMMLLLLLLLVSASLLYYAENGAQPDKFASIPGSLWWGVATITTVGYGDVYPVTVLGQFLAAVVAILGLGMFALPTGLLGAGFVEELSRRHQAKTLLCPHCGRLVEIPDTVPPPPAPAGETALAGP
jgi:voltage-gated potassium channel